MSQSQAVADASGADDAGAGRASAELVLDGLGKTFPGGVRALDGVSLTVAAGELVAIVGPSGSGKTTLLRLIAGLDPPSAGRIVLAGRDLARVAPKDRDVAMVFQNHVLYPHLTVFGNLAFGLRLRGLKRAEMDRRVAEAAELLGLADLLRRKPGELSGGQRQRVALGRAIVRRPRLFLFDEPLSNLDAALRGQLRDEIRRLHRRLAATMLYVTHDQAEALALGQRVAVLCAGRLRQVGPPLAVFGRPADAAVAALFGGAQTHTGRLERRGATTVFVAADLCVPLPAEHPAAAAAEQPPGRPATLGLQAGAIVLFDPATRQTL